MSNANQNNRAEYDAIVIGAGIAGMYQLLKLREAGFSVRVYEAGSGVGGTWYWNRYPGCRFDSESYSYGYSFSKELLQEWDWTEHFSPQPETEKYLNYVADKFDLRKDIQFDSRVKSAIYNETDNRWDLTLEEGGKARSKFLISATGPLSAPQMPKIEGLDSFKGEWHHTGLWPKEPVDLVGKRIGVIGTGATGVQVIQEVAKVAGTLTVFQRNANWCAPLHNSKIDAETQKKIKSSYDEIFNKTSESFGAFIHNFDPRSALEVNPEEREAFFEKLYAEPGFGIWLGNYMDTAMDEKANKLLSEFVAKKTRERINDPAVADKLIPKNHGFGTKRVPMETNYFEVYNQDNVSLIDIKETPIECITPTGIKTRDGEFDLDIIIFATGFDAVLGALKRIDIRGKGGLKLTDKWADGPQTYLGMQAPDFPNFFTLVGPNNGSTFCNIPRCIEQNVEWVSELLEYMREGNYEQIEPSQKAADGWAEHVQEGVEKTLFATADSWFMGYNANTTKKNTGFLLYAGSAPVYKKICEDVAKKGYEGFVLQ